MNTVNDKLIMQYQKINDENKKLEIKISELNKEIEEKEDECDNNETKIRELRSLLHNLIERNNINDKIIKIHIENTDYKILFKYNINHIDNLKFIYIMISALYFSFSIFSVYINLYWCLIYFLALNVYVYNKYHTYEEQYNNNINKFNYKIQNNIKIIKNLKSKLKEIEYTNKILEHNFVDSI